MAIAIEQTKRETGLTLRVQGEVDVSNAQDLRDAVNAALESGEPHIVVDIAQVPYIDSTGIGVLVGGIRRAKKEGLTMTVANPQRNVARVFSLLGVDAELGMSDA